MSKNHSRDQHIAAIQAEKDRIESMTPVGQRRVFASFPELRDLFDRCAWLVSVVDPTVGRTYGTIGRTSDHDNVAAMMAAGDRVKWFRGKQKLLNDELEVLNKQLADKIEATEHDRYREESPRCWRRGCVDEEGESTRGRRQSFENEVCQWCGEPFSRGQTA